MRAASIEAAGILCAAGQTAPQVMVSMVMRLQLFEELTYLDATGEPIAGAPSPIARENAQGPERLLAHAALALDECANEHPPGPSAIMLCAPAADPMGPGATELGEQVMAGLLTELGIPFERRLCQVFAAGPEGVFQALVAATALLEEGRVRSCYVGGADSFIEDDRLDILVRAGRALTSDAVEGVVPGEGGAFVRLEARPSARSLGLLTGLALRPPPEAPDADPSAALAEAAGQALSQGALTGEDVSLVLHGAAGSRERALHIARVVTRLALKGQDLQVSSPLTCAGEVGAAFGPLALAQAAYFLQGDLTPGPAALVLDAGPDLAGAAVVTRGSEGNRRGHG